MRAGGFGADKSFDEFFQRPSRPPGKLLSF
jgi:hypothetical protein